MLHKHDIIHNYYYYLQATQIRLVLAKILEEEHSWSRSAEVLCGIPMDSGQK